MDSDYKDRSRSKNKKDKDKKKKKKHDDVERSRSHTKKKHSQRQRDYDDGYDRDRERERDRDREHKSFRNRDKSTEKQRQKYRDKDVERDDKDKEPIRDREKGRDKDRERQRDRDRDNRDNRDNRDRGKQRERDRDRQRDKDKQRQRQRQRQRERERERDRDRDRGKEKDRQRQKQKQKQKAKPQKIDNQPTGQQIQAQNQNEQKSAQKMSRKKRKKSSSVEKKKSRKERRSISYQRSRSRDKRKKKKSGFDRYRSKRQSKISSSSSSDSSQQNFSDDPEQVQKLAQMKAAKQLVSSKADRKLYLGNLPPNITSQQLMDMLNGALKKMEINTDVQGDSIVSAWISPDGVGHYAFVQFRSAQEATNGLTLNGASLFGYQLKLGRPKQYIQYNKTLLSQMGTDRNLQTILKKVSALGPETLPPIEQRIIYPPSKIIALKYIVSIEQLAIDEEFDEILEDVKEMAQRFGKVVDIVIPRPHQIINLELAPKRVKGLGLIFIQYEDLSQAKFARSQFVTKSFSGQPVACCFFDQEQFRQQQYDLQQKVIIDF